MSTATLPQVLCNGFDTDAICKAVQAKQATQEQVFQAVVALRRGGHLQARGVLDLMQGGALTDAQASQALDVHKQAGVKALSCKVSQKGALSVYGLQRMPVTLYSQQWARLLDFADEIRQFATDNADVLSVK